MLPARDPSDDDADADIQFSPVASPTTSLTNRESYPDAAVTHASDPNPQDTSEATLHPDHTLEGGNRDALGDVHIESPVADSSRSPVLDSGRSYMTTDSNYTVSDAELSDDSYIEVKSINYSGAAKVKPANHKPDISEAFVVPANRETANGFAVTASTKNELDADAALLTSTNSKPASNATAAPSTNDKPSDNVTATTSTDDEHDDNVTASASTNDKYAGNVTVTTSTNSKLSDNVTATASNDTHGGNVTASASTNNKSSGDATAAKSTFRKNLFVKISDPTPNGKIAVGGASENVIGGDIQVGIMGLFCVLVEEIPRACTRTCHYICTPRSGRG